MNISSILVIEDEKASLEIIGDLIKASGVKTVCKVPSAEDAARMLAYQKFSCIVSDYRLPGVDGVTFLETLRSEGDLTPVVMLSGSPDKGGVIRAKNLPNVEFLGKPFKTAELMATLEKLLANAK